MRWLAVVALWFASPALAQSLITNTDFDTDLTGWLLSAPPPVWDAFDIDLSPTSGSALLVNAEAGAGSDVTALARCLNLPLPGGVVFGISGYIPGGQATAGSVVVRLNQYRDPDCDPTGGFGGLTGYFVVQSTTTDTWVGTYEPQKKVPGIDSIGYEVGIRKTEAGGTFMAFVDAALLEVDPLIFADDFE